MFNFVESLYYFCYWVFIGNGKCVVIKERSCGNKFCGGRGIVKKIIIVLVKEFIVFYDIVFIFFFNCILLVKKVLYLLVVFFIFKY